MENNSKPAWKMDDEEFLREFKRRGQDAKVLDALQKVQRMIDITAENRPNLAEGLRVARGLIDTYAIQFGGEAVVDLKELLREPAPGPKLPRVPVENRENTSLHRHVMLTKVTDPTHTYEPRVRMPQTDWRGPIAEPEVRKRAYTRRKVRTVWQKPDPNSNAGRIRTAVDNMSGEITANRILDTVPDVRRSDVCTCLMYLVQKGTLIKTGTRKQESNRGKDAIIYGKPPPEWHKDVIDQRPDWKEPCATS